MSGNKPRRVAILSSLGLGVVAFVSFYFAYSFLNNFLLASLIGALVVIASALILYYSVVERYFENRIKLIYKNIYQVKRGGPIRAKKSKNALQEADENVSAWAEEFKSELNELKSREKFRREFIGNVSHELKTPIFNIQGYLLTLLDGGLEDENINRQYLKRASKSVDRLINLIQDMDTLNRLESKVIELKLVDFDLVDLVNEVLDMLEDKAKKSKVSLNFKTPFDKIILVNADIQRIEQVLFNLIVNAIKYNDKKEGEVNVMLHNLGDSVMVEIKDNGMGIPEQDVNRIFERFYRVDKSRTRGTGGSGLGLSIVKHIIDQHHQILNVSSEDGKGSTFTFTLAKAKG
jgi:two-component system phosphate regulon sensor histidine kinase PhoR